MDVIRELKAQQEAALRELERVKGGGRVRAAGRARENLRRAGIIGGDGKLTDPYR